MPRRRIQPALVISLIALFMALGGTGYAAVKLPKNSVGSKQIKKDAVTTTKVKNGSLTAGDLRKSSRLALKGQIGDRGPAGAAGATGAPGAKGDTGNRGPAGATNVTVATQTCGPAPCSNATATCPSGSRATGGGGNAGGNQVLFQSQPIPSGSGATPTGWLANGFAPGGGSTGSVTAYAVCAAP